MKHRLHEIVIDTKSDIEFIDITERVRGILVESGIEDGFLNIFSSHTTAGVKITEHCERLQQDICDFLRRIVPKADYRHDEDTVDDRPNARMHLMSLLLGASETIPVAGGRMLLGSWQSIFFVELDGPRNARKVFVKAIGS